MKYNFEKLSVFQDARTYIRYVYAITKLFPNNEHFALCQQLQRAAVSIASNIVEGTSQISNKEKIRFIEISYASLMETYCQFLIAFDLNYISEDKLTEIQQHVDKIANKLGALKRSYLQ